MPKLKSGRYKLITTLTVSPKAYSIPVFRTASITTTAGYMRFTILDRINAMKG
jgi:hypothetical protein